MGFNSSNFPAEEPRRGKLGNGRKVMPETRFTQVPNGTQTGHEGGGLTPATDISRMRVKSGNVEKNLNGGLY